MNKLNKVQEKRFDEKFNDTCIFNTDNFEDPEAIRHPCYAHYGVGKAFKQHLADELWREKKRWNKILVDFDKDANKRCGEALARQKKEHICDKCGHMDGGGK